MGPTIPGGKEIQKPKLECPCGYMSESDYEKVRHGDVCIEAMKASKKNSAFQMRLWKPFHWKIYLVSSSQDLPRG
ncbi:hypothetical protein BV898_14653 [Hypsibius exemplaris]|uniref:Uncharacterized protein n=1 Tax=Hypsibius exemplaris TaxID=2072580 RepID=A0A9X6NAZ6_HYPEX|nr:hypothetical protein BV898_14653 [Hypsibius exemplaris]